MARAPYSPRSLVSGAARARGPLPPRPCDESSPQPGDDRANRPPQGTAPRHAGTTTAPWIDSRGVPGPPLASVRLRGPRRPSCAASLLDAHLFLLIASASHRFSRPYSDREALAPQVTEGLWHLAPRSENPGVGGSIPSQPTIVFSPAGNDLARAARTRRSRRALLTRTVLELTRFVRVAFVRGMTGAAGAWASWSVWSFAAPSFSIASSTIA